MRRGRAKNSARPGLGFGISIFRAGFEPRPHRVPSLKTAAEPTDLFVQ
jgi:hypothetical protein